MGQPMERKNHLFGYTDSFAKAFPQLEEALIEYRETGDGVHENRLYVDPSVFTKPEQINEPIMRCSNPRCERGGYEIDREIEKMTYSKALYSEFVLQCPGDEGSPKGRRKGAECMNALHVRLTLRYKVTTK